MLLCLSIFATKGLVDLIDGFVSDRGFAVELFADLEGPLSKTLGLKRDKDVAVEDASVVNVAVVVEVEVVLEHFVELLVVQTQRLVDKNAPHFDAR